MKTLLSLAFAGLMLVAGPAAAENWHKYSYSGTTAYLADVDSIATEGELTGIRVAKVPLSGANGDYTHVGELISFDCAARRVRTVLEVYYGPGGTETDRYDDADAPWDEVIRDSFIDLLRSIACNGVRSSDGSWPSIAAFVDGGARAPARP